MKNVFHKINSLVINSGRENLAYLFRFLKEFFLKKIDDIFVILYLLYIVCCKIIQCRSLLQHWIMTPCYNPKTKPPIKVSFFSFHTQTLHLVMMTLHTSSINLLIMFYFIVVKVGIYCCIFLKYELIPL